FKFREDLADDAFFDDGVDGDPFGIAECGDGRIFECGQDVEYAAEIVAADVEKEADVAGGGDGALQHQDKILRFLALPRIGDGVSIDDENGGGLEHGVDDAQAIG